MLVSTTVHSDEFCPFYINKVPFNSQSPHSFLTLNLSSINGLFSWKTACQIRRILVRKLDVKCQWTKCSLNVFVGQDSHESRVQTIALFVFCLSQYLVNIWFEGVPFLFAIRVEPLPAKMPGSITSMYGKEILYSHFAPSEIFQLFPVVDTRDDTR